MEKLRNIQNVNQNKRMFALMEDDQEAEDYSSDPVPLFHMSTDNDKFGMIIGLNQAGASLFCYTKSELINQKIQTIMPKLFGKYHDQFLENFLNNNEAKSYSKDRVVYGKTKSGYLIQVTLNIKMMNQAMQGVSFLGALLVEKNLKPTAFIMTDE